MAGMTNAHEADCLTHMVGGSEFTWSAPPNLYLCLFHTADPTEAGTLTNEVEYNEPRTAISYKSAVSGRANNNQILSIDTTPWEDVDILYWGLSKTAVRGAGVLNWFGPTDQTITYSPGDILTIAADTLYCTFYDGPQVGQPNNLKITDIGANKWLDHSLGTTQWTGLAACDVSLHTAAPATAVNEFSAVGYGRDTFTAGSVSAGVGDYQKISHDNALSFTNVNSDGSDPTLAAWGIWQGADLIFIRDQGSAGVTQGSSVNAVANTLEIAVD